MGTSWIDIIFCMFNVWKCRNTKQLDWHLYRRAFGWIAEQYEICGTQIRGFKVLRDIPRTCLAILMKIFDAIQIDQSHQSHNAPVPYPTTRHSEQKCAHFCSEWCVVGYGTRAFCFKWILTKMLFCCNFNPGYQIATHVYTTAVSHTIHVS